MSIRQGKKLIASSTTNGFSLFDCKWADHILNNISWLRADTFSWQSGDVYKSAYRHLVADYENISVGTLYAWNNGVGSYVYTLSESPSVGDSVYDSLGVLDSSSSVINVANGGIYVGEDEVSSLLYTRDSSRDTKIPQTETIGSTTIAYYLAEDGHKICLADQEANISALYEQTGVAWYYILDTVNKQFKLPRTKFGFTGIRSGVGKYVEAGLPNIEGYFGPVDDSTFVGAKSGAFYKGSSVSYDATSSGSGSGGRIAFDASLSDATYGRAETVQPRATEMYLYFYVGNYVENATTVDVGKLTEIVSELNSHRMVAFQAPTSATGYKWYRKYADGWVEQGVINVEIATAIYTFNFPILMANTSYTVMTSISDALNTTSMVAKHSSKATTGVNVRCSYQSSSIRGDIMVCGMAA